MLDVVTGVLDENPQLIVKPPKVYEKDIVRLIEDHDLIRSQKTYDEQTKIGFEGR